MEDAKTRDPYADTIKGLLIFLVVIGHFLEVPSKGSTLVSSLHGAIYLFHMPAFAMISGAFSSADLGERRSMSIVRSLLVPFVLFQIIYVVFKAMIVEGFLFSIANLMNPQDHLWYLIALVWWRLFWVILDVFKPWIQLAIAVTASLVVGCVPNPPYDVLGLYKTLGMLPVLRPRSGDLALDQIYQQISPVTYCCNHDNAVGFSRRLPACEAGDERMVVLRNCL